MPLLSKDNVLLIALAGVLLATIYAGPGLTSFYIRAVSLNASLYVNASYKACIYPIITPSRVLYDTQTFFFSSLDDCGSQPIQGNLYTVIMNSTGGMVDGITSPPYSLLPGQRLEYNTTWDASGQALGVYTVHCYDNVTNHTAEANATFWIYCTNNSRICFGNSAFLCYNETEWILVENCSYLCVNGTCIPPEAPEVPAAPGGFGGYARLSVECPESVTVQQGGKTIFFIKASNNGSLRLTNVYLYLEAEGVAATTPPLVVPGMNPGDSVTFVAEADASEADVGSYSITWFVVSDQVSKKGEAAVSVVERAADEQACHEMIGYYFGLIDYLEREIREAELQGRDVSGAGAALHEAVQELAAAEELRDMGLWPECAGQGARIRERITEAGILLAKARTRPVQVITIINLTDLLYVLLIAILVALIVIIIMRKSNKRESLRRVLYKLDYF